MIRIAAEPDLNDITLLARSVAKEMHQNGIDQWSSTYPAYENFAYDLSKNSLFVFLKDNRLVGSITILPEDDPFYKELIWEGKQAYVVHRLMVEPAFMRQHIGRQLFLHAISHALAKGCDAVKVDTHPNNIRMQSLILSLGFKEKGYIKEMNRIGYELLI